MDDFCKAASSSRINRLRGSSNFRTRPYFNWAMWKTTCGELPAFEQNPLQICTFDGLVVDLYDSGMRFEVRPPG